MTGLLVTYVFMEPWQPVPVVAMLTLLVSIGPLLKLTKTSKSLEDLTTGGALVLFFAGLLGAFIVTRRWYPVQSFEAVGLTVVLVRLWVWTKRFNNPVIELIRYWCFFVLGTVGADLITGRSVEWISTMLSALIYTFMARRLEKENDRVAEKTSGGIAQF